PRRRSSAAPSSFEADWVEEARGAACTVAWSSSTTIVSPAAAAEEGGTGTASAAPPGNVPSPRAVRNATVARADGLVRQVRDARRADTARATHPATPSRRRGNAWKPTPSPPDTPCLIRVVTPSLRHDEDEGDRHVRFPGVDRTGRALEAGLLLHRDRQRTRRSRSRGEDRRQTDRKSVVVLVGVRDREARARHGVKHLMVHR